MVTGIRGTSGYVSVIDENCSELAILDGEVEAVAEEGVVKREETESHVIGAAQIATFTLVGEQCKVGVESLEPDQIPGFVAQEVKKSEALKARIEQATGFDVEEIAAKADELLESDEEKARIEQKPTPTPRREYRKEKKEPYYEPAPAPTPTPTPMPTPTSTPTPIPTPTPTPTPTPIPTPTPTPTPDPSPDASPDPSPDASPDPSPDASPDPPTDTPAPTLDPAMT